MPDIATANRGYPKPHEDNNLDYDIDRVKSAWDAVDADMAIALAATALLAPLASPTFTGTPTAPTAVPGNATSQLSTTAFVQAAIDALVNASPGALDTLDELAAALGDDADFAATMTAALAGKADEAATTAALELKLALSGGTITGDLEVNGNLTEDGKSLQTPPGIVSAYAGTSAPTGYLECDGSSVSRTVYADLFSALGVVYGSVDGSSFSLPDYRGEFLRGFDNTAGNDPDAASRTDRGDGTTGDAVGTKQADELAAHTHGGIPSIASNGSSGASPDARQLGASTTSTGGNETRPRNVGVMWIIKT